MINEQDSVYKKHKNCAVEPKWIEQHGKAKMRLFCLEHSKWLHYLTDDEADFLLDSMPYELKGE